MKKTIILLFMFVLPLQAQELKIASWNIAWLGSHKFNTRTADDYSLLAKYAKQLDADVITPQKVN